MLRWVPRRVSSARSTPTAGNAISTRISTSPLPAVFSTSNTTPGGSCSFKRKRSSKYGATPSFSCYATTMRASTPAACRGSAISATKTGAIATCMRNIAAVVVHQYYDHRSQQHKRQRISQEEMLQHYVSHILARYFKMVRHYGFLANRKRGTLLPKVYDALAMTVQEKPKRPGFAVLMKVFFGTDPYQCILCKGRLRFAGAVAGEHATKMLSDRLQRMAKKRWFQTLLMGKCA